jgi:hypothetical protein
MEMDEMLQRMSTQGQTLALAMTKISEGILYFLRKITLLPCFRPPNPFPVRTFIEPRPNAAKSNAFHTSNPSQTTH